MKLLKINTETGMFIEDIITDTVPTVTVDGEALPDPQYVTTECPPGFYWPKWDGEQWVEGRTQEEIDAILAEQSAYVPTQEDRLAALEAGLLEVILNG